MRLRDLSGGAGDVMLAVSGEGVTASPTSVLVQLDGSGEGSVEVTVDALADSPLPGQATLVLSAEGMERRLPVTLLLATRLGAVTASSTFAGHPAESAIDGVTDSSGCDTGQGWKDGTANAYPDELTVTFDLPATVGRIRAHTLDSAQYPAADFGIVDADLQINMSGEWRTVAEVRGNVQGVLEATFPAVQAEAVRVVVLAARVSYSRVIELEALPV